MGTRAFCCRKIRRPTPLEAATTFLLANVRHVGQVLDDMVDHCSRDVEHCDSEHCNIELIYESLRLNKHTDGADVSLEKLEDAIKIIIVSFFESETDPTPLHVKASVTRIGDTDSIRIEANIYFSTF